MERLEPLGVFCLLEVFKFFFGKVLISYLHRCPEVFQFDYYKKKLEININFFLFLKLQVSEVDNAI